MRNQDELIAAIATPPGEGGIGIVRISGDGAKEIMNRMFDPQQPDRAWQSHRLYFGRIINPANEREQVVIDEGFAVYMAAPHSYTAQDVVEFQVHGGPVVLAKVLEAVLFCGARLAERGEFTLRAYLNGRLDLAEAEAVQDLICAKTPQAALIAAGQLSGTLSRKVDAIGDEILELVADVVVGIDFPEDEDVPEKEIIRAKVDRIVHEIDVLIEGAVAGRVYREGYSVVLCGAPNVGKSSLLNVLLEEERAIVTKVPGTTRDVIEEYVNIGGFPLLLSDTAGLRESGDEVETIGIDKSRDKVSGAQMLLLVIDATVGLDEEAQSILAEHQDKPVLLVVNKCDKLNAAPILDQIKKQYPDQNMPAVSAKTGQGIEDLKQKMVSFISGGHVFSQREAAVSNARHQEALIKARQSLLEVKQTLSKDGCFDTIDVDLQEAWQAIGEISGKTAGEEVIEKIFSTFCLGK